MPAMRDFSAANRLTVKSRDLGRSDGKRLAMSRWLSSCTSSRSEMSWQDSTSVTTLRPVRVLVLAKRSLCSPVVFHEDRALVVKISHLVSRVEL